MAEKSRGGAKQVTRDNEVQVYDDIKLLCFIH